MYINIIYKFVNVATGITISALLYPFLSDIMFRATVLWKTGNMNLEGRSFSKGEHSNIKIWAMIFCIIFEIIFANGLLIIDHAVGIAAISWCLYTMSICCFVRIIPHCICAGM